MLFIYRVKARDHINGLEDTNFDNYKLIKKNSALPL